MQDILIYGFGGLGKIFYNHALASGLNIIEIFDNNKLGDVVDGIEISNPITSRNKNLPVIITILTESVDLYTLKAELKEIGFLNVMNIVEAIKFFNLFEFTHFFAAHPDLYKNSTVIKKIEYVRGMLSDNESIKILEALIESRQNGCFENLNTYEDKENHYFPGFFLNHLKSKKNISVLDLGACYGDLLKGMIGNKININKYIAFEPDMNNLIELNKNIISLGVTGLLQPVCVADFNGLIGFESNQGVSSHVDVNSDSKAVVVKIDDVVHQPVDFVKMDIEGFEKEALVGMTRIIEEYKPALAISLYHKPLDFLEIPIMLSKMGTDKQAGRVYTKFFIRVHERSGFEVVLYAI